MAPAEPVSQPLTGVTIPSFWSHIDPNQVISVVALILFVVWALYTLVTAYHLLRYGHRSAISIPALITHVLVSAYLALFAISGMHP